MGPQLIHQYFDSNQTCCPKTQMLMNGLVLYTAFQFHVGSSIASILVSTLAHTHTHMQGKFQQISFCWKKPVAFVETGHGYPHPCHWHKLNRFLWVAAWLIFLTPLKSPRYGNLSACIGSFKRTATFQPSSTWAIHSRSKEKTLPCFSGDQVVVVQLEPAFMTRAQLDILI